MKNETKYLVGTIIANGLFSINFLLEFFFPGLDFLIMTNFALLGGIFILFIFGLFYLFFAEDKKMVIYGIIVNSIFVMMLVASLIFFVDITDKRI